MTTPSSQLTDPDPKNSVSSISTTQDDHTTFRTSYVPTRILDNSRSTVNRGSSENRPPMTSKTRSIKPKFTQYQGLVENPTSIQEHGTITHGALVYTSTSLDTVHLQIYSPKPESLFAPYSLSPTSASPSLDCVVSTVKLDRTCDADNGSKLGKRYGITRSCSDNESLCGYILKQTLYPVATPTYQTPYISTVLRTVSISPTSLPITTTPALLTSSFLTNTAFQHTDFITYTAPKTSPTGISGPSIPSGGTGLGKLDTAKVMGIGLSSIASVLVFLWVFLRYRHRIWVTSPRNKFNSTTSPTPLSPISLQENPCRPEPSLLTPPASTNKHISPRQSLQTQRIHEAVDGSSNRPLSQHINSISGWEQLPSLPELHGGPIPRSHSISISSTVRPSISSSLNEATTTPASSISMPVRPPPKRTLSLPAKLSRKNSISWHNRNNARPLVRLTPIADLETGNFGVVESEDCRKREREGPVCGGLVYIKGKVRRWEMTCDGSVLVG